MTELLLFRMWFDEFVRAREDARWVIVHDRDADGIAAGVVLQKALERRGLSRLRRWMPDRERNLWTPDAARELLSLKAQALIVADLGSRSEPVLKGVPTIYVDHHRPEGVAPGDLLLSAYRWEPIPSTSLLAWEICNEDGRVADLDWVAALGLMSDLGDRAPFELIAHVRVRHKLKHLKEAVTLINALRRAPGGDPELAARALVRARSPQELVEEPSPELERMREARVGLAAALNEAKKQPPVFSDTRKVALVRVSSPYQVHPLIAQIWRARLPKYAVLVANDGYLPNRVSFSARTDLAEGVLDLLRSIKLPGDVGSFGHGHDHASGGSLPPERWNLLLEKLGFPAKARFAAA